MNHSLLIDLFTTLCALSATMVIVSPNPIHSVGFLILVFTNTTALLLCFHSQAEFIALMFLIIYVGAIAVLFLFVVMMLNIKSNSMNNQLVPSAPLGVAALFFFFGSLGFTLVSLTWMLAPAPSAVQWMDVACGDQNLCDAQEIPLSALLGLQLGSYGFASGPSLSSILDQAVPIGSVPIGTLIYTHYYYTLLLAGIILLVAMIGAILLTMHKRSFKKGNPLAKKQLIYKQVARRFDLALDHVD